MIGDTASSRRPCGHVCLALARWWQAELLATTGLTIPLIVAEI